jgi:mannitol/fructose-specific phosphotransferase system IIA component (Ntr-type)
MALKGILKKELVLFSNLSKKKDILEAMIRLIDNEKLVEDAEVLRQSIFSREEIMSTGIGLGIAVPHARITGVKNILIAVGINKNAVEDYESIDGTPVRLVIMIIAGEKQHREYLRLLSQIVKILKKNSRVHHLSDARNADEVIHLLSEDFNNSHPGNPT